MQKQEIQPDHSMLHIEVGSNSVQKVHNILCISHFCLLSSCLEREKTIQTIAHLVQSDRCALISDGSFMPDLFGKTRREVSVNCRTIIIFKKQFLHCSLEEKHPKHSMCKCMNPHYSFICSKEANMWNVCPFSVIVGKKSHHSLNQLCTNDVKSREV